jgi:SAM-dependent methyltransferase
MVARYDGLADWYEHEFMGRPDAGGDTREIAARLLGPGTGRLLDVGCGTGAYAETLAGLGWTLTGVDVSEDMLRIARDRQMDVVRADARTLPFGDGTFDAALSLWTHTDVDDFHVVVREIARVLRPDSTFVYIGAHPCFVGPHARFAFGEGVPELHHGYTTAGRYDATAPGVTPGGLRERVGAVHLPLQELMSTFLEADFRLEAIVESALHEYPHMLGLRWRR